MPHRSVVCCPGCRRFAVLAPLALWGAILTASTAAAADDPGGKELKSVLEALTQNEALLANIDVQWHGEYIGGQASGVRVQPNEVSNRVDSGRFVQQGPMFFVEHKGEQSTGQRQGIKLGRTRAYDGERTVGLEDRGDLIANITSGPELDSNVFHAHLLPLRRQGILVPLATFLAGSEAIRNDPRGRDDDVGSENLRLTSSWGGIEEVADLKCHRIDVLYEMRESATSRFVPSNRRVFWLAIDRNLLPVKAVSYRLALSEAIPIEETRIDEFQEIQLGVWYPRSATHTVHDFDSIKHEGKGVVRAEERWMVDSVTLNPNHDRAFFQSIDIPDGTAVYEMENGEIVKSYFKGYGAPQASSPDKGRWRSVLFIANGAVVVAVTSFLLWRRRGTPAA